MSQEVNYDLINFKVEISKQWDPSVNEGDLNSTPYLDSIGEEFILSFLDIELVEKFKSFNYEVQGTTQTRTLEIYFRVSRDQVAWTGWILMDEDVSNFPPFDPLDKMYLDIKFLRTGTKSDGRIRVLSFILSGDLYGGEEGTKVVGSNSNLVISTPSTLKVFRIDDIEIISPNNLENIQIKYRFSQDNKRTWSNWEILTKENISTIRINPIRFFNIEYLVTNPTQFPVKISDINLIGDFQNVSEDYRKINLYGIRECCQSYIVRDENGNPIPSGEPGGVTGNLSSDGCDPNALPQLSQQDKANLWNPYQQNAAINLLDKLSNDAVALFGHRVRYFSTDPDGKGIDYSLNEFQLYNIVCDGEMKVTVENNQFPDSQITMNTFDLSLFDSFEIQIPKKEFKRVFGSQRRPSKEDIIWFCDINRIFIVDHSQQFRSFNNAAVFYKVILKKYNKAANVIAGTNAIDQTIKELTKNTTIDELFGLEIELDKKAVANKKEQQTLSRDPIRLEFKAEIVKELVENSSTVISKQHYDFSNLLVNGFVSMTQSVPGVIYRNMISTLRVSDNIGYFTWFKLNNYLEDEVYNLFDSFDSTNNLGWKVDLQEDTIRVNINGDLYELDLGNSLSEDVWYCYVLNIDQRQRKISQWVYKRDVDDEDEDDAKFLTKTNLRQVYFGDQDMIPVEFELENIDGRILSSDIKMTNIRLFWDIIPQTEHNSLLNQYIIGGDSKYLVFADNANTKITLPNYPYGTKDN